MKNWIASLGLALLSMSHLGAAHANSFADLRTKMTAARESLVVMATTKEKRGPDQQALVKDTANSASAALAKLKAPAGKEAQFKELNETWAAFKKTRETELVPAILGGKEELALKLAGGIQKERFTRCMSLLSELGG
ncbi:hypothetical protein [Rhodoferax aquaticus]|uniref:Uncharacterized protein n=1 Tax=Rhodoferax aquaticus TaxID=2527691 RepID=A0A515EM69_9BURK|nr:hypothetical protein [Rhodoferax aquaticus]QDL53773.1 hypothetical protein EXZ61_06065 [Rhodoferax aquaticus]